MMLGTLPKEISLENCNFVGDHHPIIVSHFCTRHTFSSILVCTYDNYDYYNFILFNVTTTILIRFEHVRPTLVLAYRTLHLSTTLHLLFARLIFLNNCQIKMRGKSTIGNRKAEKREPLRNPLNIQYGAKGDKLWK